MSENKEDIRICIRSFIHLQTPEFKTLARLEEHLYVPMFSIDPEDFILIQIYISGNKADILIFRVSFCKHWMLSKQCKHEILKKSFDRF